MSTTVGFRIVALILAASFGAAVYMAVFTAARFDSNNTPRVQTRR